MASREFEEVTTVKRKRILYTCDLCKRDELYTIQECFICGREVCGDCYIYMHDLKKMWHEYEHCCCKECWKAGSAHIDAMDKKEHEFVQMFRKEIADWKRECKLLADKKG